MCNRYNRPDFTTNFPRMSLTDALTKATNQGRKQFPFDILPYHSMSSFFANQFHERRFDRFKFRQTIGLEPVRGQWFLSGQIDESQPNRQFPDPHFPVFDRSTCRFRPLLARWLHFQKPCRNCRRRKWQSDPARTRQHKRHLRQWRCCQKAKRSFRKTT